MLRAESVSYSSVPQDEGTTPGSTFTTSRSPYNPNSRRDCQLTAIITTVVIVTGLTLAALIPLIIKSSTSTETPLSGSSGRLSDYNDSDLYASSHLNGGKDQDAVTEISDYDYDSMEDSNLYPYSTKGPVVDVHTTKRPAPPPEPVEATVKTTVARAVTIPPPRLTVNEDAVETVKDTVTTGIADIAPAVAKVVTALPERPAPPALPIEGTQQDVNEQGSGSVNLNENTQTKVSVETGDDVDLDQLLNDIYGEEGDARPSSHDIDSWTSDVISTKDKVTLVILAAVVAVAVAAVVAAVAWLIYSRVAARRRRINIQNVITDLQSRDKIVLLNSEESEEE